MRVTQDTMGATSGGARYQSGLAERLDAILAFRAPYLEDKLLRLRAVENREQAAALFQEAKKYLVLAELADAPLPMFSQRVDQAWHEFVLFTQQYAAFCQAFAGHFIHHEPLESPQSTLAGSDSRPLTRAQFQALYERWFGALPDLWRDEQHLTPDTRLIASSWATPLCMRLTDKHAELCSQRGDGEVLCRASRFAQHALRFIAQTPRFLVRELPGLDPEQRVALCAPLVAADVLIVSV